MTLAHGTRMTSLQLAVRNVARNRRRSLLAASAVFFGVFALLCIRGSLNGLQTALRSVLVERHSGALQVHRAGYLKQVVGTPLSLSMKVDDGLLERIRSVEHVVGVSPRLVFGGMLSANDTTALAVVTAFDPAREYQVCPAKPQDVTNGKPVSAEALDGVVAASSLLRRLKWDGSTPGAILAGDRDGVLNAVDVKPSGSLGLPNVPGLESRTVLMTLAHAQELLRMPGEATEIAIAVDDIRYTREVRDALQALLGSGYEVHSWEDLAPAVKGDQHNQEVIFAVLVAVFLLAALVGISNTMLVNMLERTREIGTMVSLGMRRGRLLSLFIVEGVALALLGCALGILGSALFLAYFNHVGFHVKAVGGGVLHIYPVLGPVQALELTLTCAAGAVVASLYPAWKASRMTPMSAMTAA
ncbi:MAG: FtsX-like permease family protein [Myxococcota bacterium]